MKSKPLLMIAFAVTAVVPSLAGAHVTLENRQATVGSGYKAVFAVPHGCAGSPTVKIRVQIPEGVIAVKPMPKAGWSVETVKGKYSTAYDYHGRTFSEGVKEVVWSGGKLSDDNYDEFVLEHVSHRQPQAQHHAVFPAGAGMRAGSKPLDRDSARGQAGA